MRDRTGQTKENTARIDETHGENQPRSTSVRPLIDRTTVTQWVFRRVGLGVHGGGLLRMGRSLTCLLLCTERRSFGARHKTRWLVPHFHEPALDRSGEGKQKQLGAAQRARLFGCEGWPPNMPGVWATAHCTSRPPDGARTMHRSRAGGLWKCRRRGRAVATAMRTRTATH
jgi:hypothetical protein